MKDLFSFGASGYKHFRPGYPSELFDLINSLVIQNNNCWDSGTGNGQLAYELSKTFHQVHATDISKQQISQAPKATNINYSVQPAEKTIFSNNFFDLVTIGQAIHWVDFERFYNEVNRTCKNDAILVVTGYGLISVNDVVNAKIDELYHHVLGPYWEPERKLIDELYQTIPFPFDEIDCHKITMSNEWSLEHFLGYLNTWSSVKSCTAREGVNPLVAFKNELESMWPDNESRGVQFPLLLRVGRICK